LPSPSIYSTDGDWEQFATPSGDSQLRAAYLDLVNEIRSLQSSVTSDADRASLRDGISTTLNGLNSTCQISYVDSSTGEPVTLRFEDVVSRLSELSFDDYACRELRWGHAERYNRCQAKNKDNFDNMMRWHRAMSAIRVSATRYSGNGSYDSVRTWKGGTEYLNLPSIRQLVGL
jgi:hypothetical protein